jgi:NCS1 nucleoside transporter family
LPGVETYGVEPVPAELRTAGWRDLFAINFTFFLNPVMYVLGALAVLQGGLPLLWAIAAMVLGQALAFSMLVVVAQPGVDDGLPGQVAMRSHFGMWGARLLTSPYRMIAATYWFAAQALTGALGFQAIVEVMSGRRLPLVPLALALALFHAVLAVLGFDVMRWLLKVVLPLSLAGAATLVLLYLLSDDPRYAPARVLESPDQQLTWVGFATFVTVMCGSSLTFVTNVADFCRYTPTRRDMRIGLIASALLSALVTTFIGGYVAAASGDTNPFVAAAALTSSDVVLVLLLLTIVVQTIAANITNTYTAGMSLVNAAPALGRLLATALVGAVAVTLSGFPSFIEEAQDWITHLGNVAAPITGVVLADYLVVKRGRIDVPSLFASEGRYRYQHGVNVAAVIAVGVAVGVYYALPQSLVKVLWGVAVAGLAYLALREIGLRAGAAAGELRRPAASAARQARRR